MVLAMATGFPKSWKHIVREKYTKFHKIFAIIEIHKILGLSEHLAARVCLANNVLWLKPL